MTAQEWLAPANTPQRLAGHCERQRSNLNLNRIKIQKTVIKIQKNFKKILTRRQNV